MSHILIIFYMTNCFIQILCDIKAESHISRSSELIDRVRVDKTVIEAQIVSELSITEDLQTTTAFNCYCEPSDEDCDEKCLDHDRSDESAISNMFLLTAGEILLGAVVVIGLTALISIMVRMFSRTRLTRNRRIQSLSQAFDRNNNRASLTSLQQTVLSKLRDRPPRYETRHNYEYRRREENEEGASERREVSMRNVAVLNPGARNQSQPPPPYENDESTSIDELPPAYTSEDTQGPSNAILVIRDEFKPQPIPNDSTLHI